MFDSAIQAPFTEALSGRRSIDALTPLTRSYKAARSARAHPTARRPLQRAERISDSEFRALYDTHCRLVARALTHYGIGHSDLMDLTQKVFLTAHLKLPSFEGRSQLSTWLWGICRRVAFAFRRSSVRRYEIVTDPLRLEASSDDHFAPSDDVDPIHQVGLEHFLSKLSVTQRVVVTLCEVEGLRGREVAAQLKVSLGTIRSRLRYARKVLRREVRRLRLANALAKARERRHAAAPARRTL